MYQNTHAPINQISRGSCSSRPSASTRPAASVRQFTACWPIDRPTEGVYLGNLKRPEDDLTTDKVASVKRMLYLLLSVAILPESVWIHTAQFPQPLPQL